MNAARFILLCTGALLFALPTAFYAESHAQDIVPAAPTAEPQNTDEWTINFKDTDIRSVIQQIAQITGENYIIAPTVTGKVDIISQAPMKKSDLKELLLSILHINGFTLSQSGSVYTIEPNTEARKMTSDVGRKGETAEGSAFIVRVLLVKYANTNDLMLAVQPLISDFAVLRNLPDSNAILIADYAGNVKKVTQIINELDYPETDEMDTVKLTNGWVHDIMPLLQKLAPRELDASGKIPMAPVRLVGDERKNVIIIKGERAARRRLRALIARLDQASEDDSTVQVIPLQNADATKAADMLKDMFITPPAGGAPGSEPPIPVSIKAHVPSNSLVVHGPPGTIASIRKVIARLDVQRTQVLIEAAIVEIDDDALNQLGTQFSAGQAAFNTDQLATSLTSGGSSTLGTPIAGLAGFLQQINAPNSGLIGDGITASLGSHEKFTALISALASNSRANLLSTPSIMTVNNEEASIVVGQNVPFRTGQFETPTSGGTGSTGTVVPFTTIQRQDVGITLKVTPQVNENNRILLKVNQEVSSVQPTTLAGAADIITNKRTINTTIVAVNGQTVALGGLITDNKSTSENKVPLLGDVPLVGFLFRSQARADTKNDLVIFLRPTVLSEPQDLDGVSLRKFNGIWELNLGTHEARLNPAAGVAQMDKLFDPNLAKPADSKLPPVWLLDEDTPPPAQEDNK